MKDSLNRDDSGPYPGYDQSGTYLTPRKGPRVRPEAEEYANKNRGSLELFGSGTPRPVQYTPRPTSRCQGEEGRQNYELGRNGRVSALLGGGATPRPDENAVPRVKPEAESIANQHKGKSTDMLFKEYGNLPRSARPAPRVKQEAADTAEKQSGSTMNNIMHDPNKIPSSARGVPRVKPEAQEIASKEGVGMFKSIHEFATPLSSRPVPRVKPEAENIAEHHRGGNMSNILHKYGNNPRQAQPEPRVKPEASEMANMDRGGRMSRLMHEGDKARCSPRPPPRATSKAAQLIIKKNRGGMKNIFAQSGGMTIVPPVGR